MKPEEQCWIDAPQGLGVSQDQKPSLNCRGVLGVDVEIPESTLAKPGNERTVTEHERRLALNEAMFREINERLESQILTFPAGQPEVSVLCECANPDCTDRIQMTSKEYRQVRTDPRQFVLTPGHEYIEIEQVVSRNDRYEIVRKTGPAGQLAEQIDQPPPGRQ
jgi:hypothetical protein